MKVKDRVLLGTIAGLSGNLLKTLTDEASLKFKISQRSFRVTAAGVWVNKKKESTGIMGQILGGFLDFGMSALGGIGIVHLLSKTGRDHVITKGILSGITIGSTISAFLSISPQNKVKPNDAASNLSYMVSHAIYGIATSVTAATLGDPILFDAKPQNNYLPPTEPTTEEKKSKSQQSDHKTRKPFSLQGYISPEMRSSARNRNLHKQTKRYKQKGVPRKVLNKR